jgi:hypothetical protein
MWYEVRGGQSGTGVGFLWVLRFPLPFIPLTAPHSSSSVIRGWYSRLNSCRRTKWTKSHSAQLNSYKITRITSQIERRKSEIIVVWETKKTKSSTLNPQAGGPLLVVCPRLLQSSIYIATWERAMPRWQGTHPTWISVLILYEFEVCHILKDLLVSPRFQIDWNSLEECGWVHLAEDRGQTA